MKNKKLKFIIFLLFFGFLSLNLIMAFQLANSGFGSSFEVTDLNMLNSENSNHVKFESKIDPFLENMLDQVNQFEMVDVIITLSYQPKMDDALPKEEKLNTFTNLIQDSQDKVVNFILNEEGTINHEFSIVNTISATVSIKTLNKLVDMDSIARIEYDYELKTSLDDSVDSILDPTGYAYSWNSSFNGSGIVVAVLDSGINETHPAFVGKVVDKFNAFDYSSNVADDEVSTPSHGTHVAGCIASVDATYTGVSPGVSLIIGKVFDSTGTGSSTVLMRGAEWAVATANPKADIINFSGGTRIAGQEDGQTSLAFFIDAITSTYDVLWINAAGNSGGGSQTIEVPADAYNSIAVGNMNDFNTALRAGDTILSSSSRGPTVDGRVKPEIVAPGTSINSPYVGGWGAVSGTSFSAPHVAGAAALLYQYFTEEESSLHSDYYALVTKAALIHTAEDWGGAGVDYTYGYGYVNMPDLYSFTQNGFFYGKTLSAYNVAYRVPYFYNVSLNASENFNLTFVWNRHASYSAGATYYYGDGVPNDFNLYLLNRSGHVVASSTDDKNNIEQLSYTPPSDDFYFLKIVVEGDLQYGGAEKIGLVSSYNLTQADIGFDVSISINPLVDLNLDYNPYNLFSLDPYNLYEQVKIVLSTSGDTQFLNGTVSYSTVVDNMTMTTNQRLEYTTDSLINLIPPNLLMSSVLLGISIQLQVKAYDTEVIQSYMTGDFEIKIHGFIFDIIPPIVIVLGTLIVVDYIRDRRARALYGPTKKETDDYIDYPFEE